MLERVTVAVDGGPASAAAVRWVIHRAESVPMRLEITAVVGPGAQPPLEPGARYRESYENALHRAKETVLAVLPGLEVTTKIRQGSAADALIRLSRHTDLLVIGTNRTSPMAGMVNGTLPLKVAGQAECTTVVVPVDWTPTTGRVVAGWTADETADAALDLAADEADRAGVPLMIAHTFRAAPAAMMDPSSTAIARGLAEANRAMFADAGHRVRLAHPKLALSQDLKMGSAAVAIVRAASGASLVVVGSRGRSAMAGFFLGSVSHDVLMNMPSPVAVVPKRKKPVDVYPELIDEDLL